ncbi:MAG: Lon protease family protein [Candidatus Aminicenantia bacterium]
MIKELKHEELRWQCDPGSLKIENSNQVIPLEGIIGQQRAIEAIKMGLEIPQPGYNIFITGLVGTGRTTTVMRLLDGLEEKEKIPNDLCYVNNFKNPDMPILIILPPGKGKEFKKEMEKMIEDLRENIPKIFESDAFQRKRAEIMEELGEKQKNFIRIFEKKVEEAGFQLIQVQSGPIVKPALVAIVHGKPMNLEQIESLVESGGYPRENYENLKKKYYELEIELSEVMRMNRELRRELEATMKKLNEDFVLPLIDQHINDLKYKFEKVEKVVSYLDEVKRSILENIDAFSERELSREEVEEIFSVYSVNLFIDHGDTKETPIIYETSPNFRNLFGTIAREMDSKGRVKSDFSMIKPGSIHRANGGYLIINANDALLEPNVWPTLKRVLRTGVSEIQCYDLFGVFPTTPLKPEAIPVNLKIVMIGNPYIYYLLFFYDEEFKKIFKIKADFDTEMDNNQENREQYISFIKMLCEEENLKPFDISAVVEIIEYGVGIAGHKNKITTRFNLIADLLRESNYWAVKEGKEKVSASHVKKAIESWKRRVNLPEEKILEMIKEGKIMIDTEGKVVGQVNGLSVISLGEYTFGRPTRITARTSVGREGIINIEREADLSGRTHNKGVLILSGFIKWKYAKDKLTPMDATICFEQSYSEVDGDSASSAEAYAILSSLSNVPLRQDIAVTGSINQKGEIQPIGGVNQKIEGFFKVCKAKGLTGTQGVIIPHQNVDNLMLDDEVVEVVKEGKFHIYAIRTIDEGIEILTGMPAGERGEDGKFPEGTFNYLVERSLSEYAEKMKEFYSLK